MKTRACKLLVLAAGACLLIGCGDVPVKRYYTLSYVPEAAGDRYRESPYPFTIRIRELSIEDAYARPQIVYRRSPFELEYYYYRVWAVKPARMVTDLIHSHLSASRLVSSVIRRYGEGMNPDYELGGMIEAIEEYDSEEIWFAHLAVNLHLTRLSDGRVIYSRRFDHRKRVFENKPEYVIKEISAILEYVLTQVLHDLDVVLAREYGMSVREQTPPDADSTMDTPEIWNR
jgi:ABC-type uncharacterized transport system auxiliary subunit